MTGTNTSSVRRPLLLAFAFAMLAGVLAGCISLFPKEAPAQLYRFTYERAEAAPAPPTAGDRFTVRALLTSFTRDASSDRILTTHGHTVGYIAGGRWAEAADSLMEEAVQSAFADRGPAALFGKGEVGPTDYRLTLSVPVFEARYLGSPTEAPTVVVEVSAALGKIGESSTRRERTFRAQVPAQSNTVSAIVAAYNSAVTQTLDQLVGWTETRGQS